jgi:diguanylate cyclase (GGDEF)-like protein
MVNPVSGNELVFGLIGLVILAFFFYFDLQLTNNIAISITYISALGFGLLSRSRRLIVLLGLLGILATLAGYAFSLTIDSGVDSVNRQMVIIAIMTITITAHIYMSRQQEFDERLYKIATTDTLTGIANRRALLQELQMRISEVIRYDRDLSVILFDLDDFKAVNDRYGHQAGDKMLQKLTQVCSNWLRTADFIGRYGGEEFMVVCPNTNIDGALALAERIRIAVEQTEFKSSGQKLKMTISVGVTELYNHLENHVAPINEVQLMHDFIDAADDAMYEAKKAGKNCVFGFNPMNDVTLRKEHV